MGLHQTKKFLHSTGNHHKIKRKPTEWENLFLDTSDKGLISSIYKVLTISTPKQNKTKDANNPIATQLQSGQRT